MSTDKKVVIVTGAGYGIGRASAELLAKDHWQVVAVDLNAAQLDETCRSIRRDGGHAEAIVGDVAQAETFARVMHACKPMGPLRGLVTCAAMRHPGPITRVTEQQWRQTLDVVLHGVFLACHSAIPAMIESGGGSIVNVTSTDAFGRRNMVTYATAKAAVNALSLCLATDHASDGIRVNVVVPPLTRTGMTEHYDPARLAALADRQVARRIALPDDPARLICFLMSDAGETFTGGSFGPQRMDYS